MGVYEELAGLNKLLHEPARLSIMTALASCEQADFLFLIRLVGLSKGNLSGHLSKLEMAGLVEITKHFVGKKPQTIIAITSKGGEMVEAHWQKLETLRRTAQNTQIV
ncbi:MAG: ArsR family transcriptional regulator [Chloroflexi bacterium]|nr:ArsR family transcriptional regulator [Chloroflexota bacterium]